MVAVVLVAGVVAAAGHIGLVAGVFMVSLLLVGS